MANIQQRGFGLVEVLVALVIGLLLLAGIIQIFLGSKQSYRTNDALAIVQENGRFAIDFISRDLRMAGFNPAREVCGNPVLLRTEELAEGIEANRDVTATLWAFAVDAADYQRMLRGTAPNPFIIGYDDYEDGDWADAPSNVKEGTDILVVRRIASGSNTVPVVTDNAETQTLTLAHPIDVAEDDTVMVLNSTCSGGAVFQVDDEIESSSQISYPGDLGFDMTDGRVVYGAGSGVEERIFYIRDDALYRRVGATEQLLVQGVEDMQVTYAVDSDGDGALDAYSAGEDVDDWSDVRGVRVSLLVRSNEDNVLPETQTVAYNGGTVSGTDGRLRQVFNTTVGLRAQMQ